MLWLHYPGAGETKTTAVLMFEEEQGVLSSHTDRSKSFAVTKGESQTWLAFRFFATMPSRRGTVSRGSMRTIRQ